MQENQASGRCPRRDTSAMPRTRKLHKWLIVRRAVSALQMRDAICVDMIRA